MILTHNKYGGSYDFQDEKLTCVIRLFGANDTMSFKRFDYAYVPEDYSEIDEHHWDMTEDGSTACKYFLDDGSRPYKKFDCETCEISEKCMNHDKYYSKGE